MKRLLISLSLIVTACTKTVDHYYVPPPKVSTDVSQLQQPDSMKAEKLIASAEELMSPLGFMYAYPAIVNAVQLDPANIRAQFYKAYLDVPMQMKGFVYRIAPLIGKGWASEKTEYQRFVSELKIGGLRDFLMSKDLPPFRSDADIQQFLTQVQAKLDTFRLFIEKNSDKEFQIEIYVPLNARKMISRCAVHQLSPSSYEVEPCPYLTSRRAQLEQADFVGLAAMVAGYEMFTAPTQSYSLDGLTGFYESAAAQKLIYGNAILDELKNVSTLGVFQQNTGMQLLQKLGADSIVALKWMAKYQNILCPDNATSESRPGMLFYSGICMPDTATVGAEEKTMQQALALAESAINGGIINVALTNATTQAVESVRMEPAAPILKPVQDLKSQIPQFDACGNPASLSDPTIGGIFPDGNAEKYVVLGSPPCDKR